MPLLAIIVAIIIILTYFFGWIIIAGTILLAVLITLGTYIYDHYRPPFGFYPFFNHTQTGRLPDEEKDYYVNGKCLVCSSDVFIVEYGKTTQQEIINFALNAKGWKDNTEAIAGHMPSGAYCPNGCFSLHTTPVIDNID